MLEAEGLDTNLPPHVLAEELTSNIVSLYERHMTNAHPWNVYEVVPEMEPLDPEQTNESLVKGVQSALIVNLLTEDNLPYYTDTLHTLFGPDYEHPFAIWVRRWTAEEWKHAAVMRDYYRASGIVNLAALEESRMVQMSKGEVPHPKDIPDALVYTTIQELATNVAHRNTGRHMPEEVGRRVMSTVAADEKLHHVFYRDLAQAALEIDPSAVVIAAARQVRQFSMPGTGIPDFEEHQRAIAEVGIYDARKFWSSVLVPTLLESWHILDVGGLTPAAKKAQEGLERRLKAIERLATGAL